MRTGAWGRSYLIRLGGGFESRCLSVREKKQSADDDTRFVV